MVVAGVVGVAMGSASVQTQGRGQEAGARPVSARGAAPVDLTGTWVSVVTEDWRWRMRVPPKGDYASVPLNAAGVKTADTWDPARDAAAGEQCRGYGAPAIMRLPGRVRISWEGESFLRVETEAGTQTRLFTFGAQGATEAAPSWQGFSAAFWQPAGGGGGRRGGGASRGGSLRVVTTNLRPGYLRRNGVPYSANVRLTEYYNRANEPNGDSWLVVTTVVEDPTYLATRWATSTHFKKVPDGSPWSPTPCE
jgi:hypothetical protein